MVERGSLGKGREKGCERPGGFVSPPHQLTCLGLLGSKIISEDPRSTKSKKKAVRRRPALKQGGASTAPGRSDCFTCPDWGWRCSGSLKKKNSPSCSKPSSAALPFPINPPNVSTGGKTTIYETDEGQGMKTNSDNVSNLTVFGMQNSAPRRRYSPRKTQRKRGR